MKLKELIEKVEELASMIGEGDHLEVGAAQGVLFGLLGALNAHRTGPLLRVVGEFSTREVARITALERSN